MPARGAARAHRLVQPMGDRMGTILHLNPPHKAAPSAVVGGALPPCEIVIFPGVRIEREAPPPEASDRHDDAGTGHDNRPRKSS